MIAVAPLEGGSLPLQRPRKLQPLPQGRDQSIVEPASRRPRCCCGRCGGGWSPGCLGARGAPTLVPELSEWAGAPAFLQGIGGLGVGTGRLGCVWLSLTSSRGGWDQPTSASPCHFSCSLAVEFTHLLGICLLTLGVGGCHLVEGGRAGDLKRLLSLSTVAVWGGGERGRHSEPH